MTEHLTDERLAELRTIAEAAQDLTPVAWGMDDGIDWDYRVMAGDKYLADTGDPVITAHIAAFDPPTTLALVDRIAELQHRLDAVEALARNGIGKPYIRTLDKIILAARGEQA